MKPSKSYLQFITDLKQSIVQSRYQATRLANREQLMLYFKVGEMLSWKINIEKWGTQILEQISVDLQKQVPGLRGFSYRNLRNMRQFFEAYHESSIWQSVTAKLKGNTNKVNLIGPSTTAQLEAFLGISFTHHLLLLNKCATEEERFFYINVAATEFWSVNVLEHQINSAVFEKQGKLPNNFVKTQPNQLTSSAVKFFNDEYLLDYMNLDGRENELQVETQIVVNIREFILKMGKGFSFMGNQFRLELEGEEFFVDLLFYNRHLQCMVAFELKRGKFKPEYAGQLNFYLNVLDEKIRLDHENFSIGIVLCKEKNNTVVEYSVRSIDKAMGVATFKTSKTVPGQIKAILPDTDDLAKLL